MKNRIHIYAACFVVVSLYLSLKVMAQQYSNYPKSQGRTVQYYTWAPDPKDTITHGDKAVKNYSLENFNNIQGSWSISGLAVGQTSLGDRSLFGKFDFSERTAYQWDFSGIKNDNPTVTSVRLEIWYLSGSTGNTVNVKPLMTYQYNMDATNRWAAIKSGTKYTSFIQEKKESRPEKYFYVDLPSTNQICQDIAQAIKAGSLFSIGLMIEGDEYWLDINTPGVGAIETIKDGNGYQGVKLTVNYTVPTPPEEWSNYFADINGDGRTDWIQISKTTNTGKIGLAQANGSINQWTSFVAGATNNYSHYFADINGDGRADWIQISKTANSGNIGLGQVNGSFQQWTQALVMGATNNYSHYFADINGDRRADWIQVCKTINMGYIGLGQVDGSFQQWTNSSANCGATNNYTHYFADINGDGRADWIQVCKATNMGYIGLGQSNGSINFWTFSSANCGATDNYTHYFADINGDGRADWIQVCKATNMGYIGLGQANGSIAFWTNSSASRGATNSFAHYFADMNGDHRADWIQVSRTVNTGWIGLAQPDGNINHWTYTLTDVGMSGSSLNKKPENAEITSDEKILLPKEVSLTNYPNPFNPSTTISYQLPVNSYVTLRVYDMLGREVAVLAEGVKDAGYYTAAFDGSRLSSGVYFARFVAQPQDGSQPFVQVKKLLMTK